jgi:uncharacterized protein
MLKPIYYSVIHQTCIVATNLHFNARITVFILIDGVFSRRSIAHQGGVMANTISNAGEFCWNRLMTADVAKAKQFYTGLFGWNAVDVDLGDLQYTTFQLNGANVGGLLKAPKANESAPPYWLSFVAVNDIDAATSRAEKLGATIAVPVTNLPNGNKVAIIRDPVGAYIGLREMSR